MQGIDAMAMQCRVLGLQLQSSRQVASPLCGLQQMNHLKTYISPDKR